MSIQVIVYSIATGRVRRVLDPEGTLEDVELLASHANPGPGEATLVYAKKGNGEDHLNSWQGAVTTVTGKAPVDDRYVAVDVDGNIVRVLHADPGCGDAIEGCRLIAHSHADERWSVNSAGVLTAKTTAPT